MGVKDLMRYYQKVVAIVAANKSVLLLAPAFFTLTSIVPGRANFSGKWKLNESKSARGHSLCVWGLGDHMRSNTMKIAAQPNFLTIYVITSSPDGMILDTTQEKLTFDGKEREGIISYRNKKSTVKWSPDRQTMTVTSIITLNGGGVKMEFNVTEVWNLINNGKSISLQADIKSASGSGDTMKLIFDKAR